MVYIVTEGVRIMNEHICAVIPQVGMGVTELMYSDAHAYTITAVDENGKWFKCTLDHAYRDEELTDKEWPHRKQVYKYETNPLAGEVKVTLRKDGRWRKAGQSSTGSMARCHFILNIRAKYYDYCF